MHRWSVPVAILLSALLATFAHASERGVAGAWKLTVESPNRTATPTVVLAVEGTALRGTYTGLAGEFPVTGTVNGNAVEFSVTLTVMGRSMPLVYSGTVDGDAISGNVTMHGDPAGKFSGKRAP